MECTYTALQLAKSFGILAFINGTSYTISHVDIIRILDTCFALRHVKSSMRKDPSGILGRVRPTSRIVLSNLESMLRSFQDDLAVKGELADVAPEELPSLTRRTLEIVVEISDFYMGSKTWLAAELPVHDATRMTRALHRLLKTCVRWFKWMEDLRDLRGRTPGQEQISSIYGTIRDARGWQMRAIKEGQQVLRLLDRCSSTPGVEHVRSEVTKIVDMHKRFFESY